jgi:sarcosine oxidase subunit beta
MTTLPRSAEVVIVGGGVMGTSIAYHLAVSGVRGVVLLERDQLGSGSSAKPLGGVRATFSDPGNIALGQRSLEAYERFETEFKVDIGLRQVGYLFLARTSAELDQLERSTAVQQQHGGSARLVTAAEAAVINPLLDRDALLGASFSPRDGFAAPAPVVQAYADAARFHGATVVEHVEVQDITVNDTSIETVQTSRGAIATSAVICAAGAWSAQIGGMVDVSLPVEPVRRQIGFTPQRAPRFPTVPFTLDLGTTLYFHNYDGGMLLGISHPDQPPGFDRDFDRQWVPAFDAAAKIVAPVLAGRQLDGGWAGLYENTPDHNAIIGASDRPDRFFYATGFSGHGFLQAPAVGEAVCDLYRGREPVVDLRPFHARRFGSEAARLSEVHII